MTRRDDYDEDGYPLAPINVSKTLWLYAEGQGLWVNGDPVWNGRVIPWRVVEKAMEAHHKAPMRARRKRAV